MASVGVNKREVDIYVVALVNLYKAILPTLE